MLAICKQWSSCWHAGRPRTRATVGHLTFWSSLRSICVCTPTLINVCTVGTYQTTALMLASASGHALIMSRLLAAGAEAGLQDFEGRCALLYASRRGHGEAVRVLLQRSATIVAAEAEATAAAEVVGTAAMQISDRTIHQMRRRSCTPTRK